MKKLWTLGVSQFSSANRLLAALRSGAFGAAPSECISIDRSDIEQGIKLFERRRPRKWLSDIADATNLAFVRSLQSLSGQPVRLVSSAPTMMTVGDAMFPGMNPVRTSRQFAVLIRERSSISHAQPLFKSADALHALGECAARLRKLLERHSGLISRHDVGLDSEEVIEAFTRFAPYYRETLRPVDEMLEDCVRALPVLLRESMDSQYGILKGQSDIVAAFKESWDRACAELAAIETILRENYGATDIFMRIEMQRRTIESSRHG